jgi:hypothetical protein
MPVNSYCGALCPRRRMDPGKAPQQEAYVCTAWHRHCRMQWLGRQDTLPDRAPRLASACGRAPLPRHCRTKGVRWAAAQPGGLAAGARLCGRPAAARRAAAARAHRAAAGRDRHVRRRALRGRRRQPCGRPNPNTVPGLQLRAGCAYERRRESPQRPLALGRASERADTLGRAQALRGLLESQSVDYEFGFYRLPMPADAPATILSAGASLLSQAVSIVLPLQPAHTPGAPSADQPPHWCPATHPAWPHGTSAAHCNTRCPATVDAAAEAGPGWRLLRRLRPLLQGPVAARARGWRHGRQRRTAPTSARRRAPPLARRGGRGGGGGGGGGRAGRGRAGRPARLAGGRAAAGAGAGGGRGGGRGGGPGRRAPRGPVATPRAAAHAAPGAAPAACAPRRPSRRRAPVL